MCVRVRAGECVCVCLCWLVECGSSKVTRSGRSLSSSGNTNQAPETREVVLQKQSARDALNARCSVSNSLMHERDDFKLSSAAKMQQDCHQLDQRQEGGSSFAEGSGGSNREGVVSSCCSPNLFFKRITLLSFESGPLPRHLSSNPS